MCYCLLLISAFFVFFFFNDTATTEIYTLSLHDALPILMRSSESARPRGSCCFSRRSELRIFAAGIRAAISPFAARRDRKSTRLNSSHGYISYAVFCLKKKKKQRPRES